MKRNKAVRIVEALEIVAQETETELNEIIESLIGTALSEEDASFLKEMFE